MPYSYNSIFSFALQSSFKPSTKSSKKDKKKKEINYEEELFKENGEAIDEEKNLFQYSLPVNDGYYIGLENKMDSPLKMKLILEGLYDPNDRDNDEITFTIDGKSKKVFYTKIDESNDDDLSFVFQLTE